MNTSRFTVLTSYDDIWNKFWKVMTRIFYAVFHFLHFNLHIRAQFLHASAF